MAGLAPLPIRRFFSKKPNEVQTARRIDIEETREATRLTWELIQTQNYEAQRTRAVLKETGRASFTLKDSVRLTYVK